MTVIDEGMHKVVQNHIRISVGDLPSVYFHKGHWERLDEIMLEEHSSCWNGLFSLTFPEHSQASPMTSYQSISSSFEVKFDHWNDEKNYNKNKSSYY